MSLLLRSVHSLILGLALQREGSWCRLQWCGGGGELHPWQPSSIKRQIIECTKLFKPLPPNRLSKSSMKVFLIVSYTGLASYPGLLWAPGNVANTGHCQSTCMTHSHFFPHNLHCLSSFSPYILKHQSSS